MNQEKIDIIKAYIEANVAPILVEQVALQSFPSAVVLEANCDKSELNGHYEGTEFVPPKWYSELLAKTDYKRVLIINGIDKIEKEEQDKFIEILKYKKISTFDIPDNTVIVIMANSLSNTISPGIISLVATIKD